MNYQDEMERYGWDRIGPVGRTFIRKQYRIIINQLKRPPLLINDPLIKAMVCDSYRNGMIDGLMLPKKERKN